MKLSAIPDMRLISNTRAKRSTAFVMLLVWVFAVASGVANACLLEAPGSDSHLGTGHVPDVSAGVAEAADDHDDDSVTSKESCLKVCDDGSQAPVKLHTGFDLTDPGVAPLVAVVWNSTAPVVWGHSSRVDLQPPIVGPPLRVRYSRLAL